MPRRKIVPASQGKLVREGKYPVIGGERLFFFELFEGDKSALLIATGCRQVAEPDFIAQLNTTTFRPILKSGYGEPI